MESREALAGHLPIFVTESASLIAATTNYEMQIFQYLFLGHQRPKLQFDSTSDTEVPPNGNNTHTWVGNMVAGVCGVIWSISEFGLDLVQIMRGHHDEQEPTGPVKEGEDHDQDEQTKPYKTEESGSTKDHSQNGRPSSESQDRESKDASGTEPAQTDAVPTNDPVPASPKIQRESKGLLSSSASQMSISSLFSRKSAEQPSMRVQGQDDENVVLLAGNEPPPEIVIGGNDGSTRGSQPSVVVMDNNPQKAGGNQKPIAASLVPKQTDSDSHSGDSGAAPENSMQGTDKDESKKNKKSRWGTAGAK